MIHNLAQNNAPFRPYIEVKGLSPSQIRAARGLLNWTRSELARRAGLSAETIKNTEQGTYSPKEETLKAITDAFAECGVTFERAESTSLIPREEDTNLALTISHCSISCIETSVTETPKEIDQ